MALTDDQKLNAGQVVAKFLLQHDMQSVLLVLSDYNPEERMEIMWATLAVMGGAIESLAQYSNVDAVGTLGRIINQRARGASE